MEERQGVSNCGRSAQQETDREIEEKVTAGKEAAGHGRPLPASIMWTEA